MSSVWQRDMRPLLRNVPLLVGSVGVVVLLLAAVVGPRLAPFDPQAWRLVEFGPDGSMSVPPIAPNERHWLGTDPMGRDLLSRLLWGAQLTLTAVGLAVVGRTVIGVGAGLLAAAWPKSLVASSILAASTAVSGVPQLLLALLLVLLLREWGLLGFVVALIAGGWADLAQFTHAEAVRLRRSAHVRAAVALGGSARHIYVGHVLRNLVPALSSLLALEAGSVLILLAELGFVGFFVSGGTFFVDDVGRPILPVRDRVPEWGQMLAGARGYTFVNQWVAFVPAIVVALVVVVLNFLSEGVRGASDPHGAHTASPRALGWLGRAAALVVLLAAVGFGQLTLGSSGLSVEDARSRALEIARRSEPSALLLAQVVRFSSDRHALARPEQLNFYYATPRGTLRVGYVDAAETGLDVRWFEDQDDLLVDRLDPLSFVPSASWQDSLTEAERIAGTRFRNGNTGYVVSVVLAQTPRGPRYLVRYAAPSSTQPVIAIPIGPNGEHERSSSGYFDDALTRAPGLLGQRATLWLAGAFGTQIRTGETVTKTWIFAFGDGAGRFVMLNYELDDTGLVPSIFALQQPVLRGGLPIPTAAAPLADASGIDDGIARLGEFAVAEAGDEPLPFTIGVYRNAEGQRELLGGFHTPSGRRLLSLDMASGRIIGIP